LANEKIRSQRPPIAAGFRGGRSRSVKSHHITYEKPQYTIQVMGELHLKYNYVQLKLSVNTIKCEITLDLILYIFQPALA
jgi:hypothetical protein